MAWCDDWQNANHADGDQGIVDPRQARRPTIEEVGVIERTGLERWLCGWPWQHDCH